MSYRDDSTGISSASEMGEPGPETAEYDDPSEQPESEIMERRAQELARDYADTGEYAAEWTQRFNGKVA